MNAKKRTWITAGELMAKLQADPEFVARQQAKENELNERSDRIRRDEEPLLKDLREVGWDVQSVWDLVNTATAYPEAIPILLKHLLLPYCDVVREGIARALAVPEPLAQKAWPILVEEYRKAPLGWGIKAPGDTKEFCLGAKNGLACCLSVVVTEETLPELIALAKDRTLGKSRILLLSPLKKRRKKNPVVKQTIDELAEDPDLRTEIASWGKR